MIHWTNIIGQIAQSKAFYYVHEDRVRSDSFFQRIVSMFISDDGILYITNDVSWCKNDVITYAITSVDNPKSNNKI